MLLVSDGMSVKMSWWILPNYWNTTDKFLEIFFCIPVPQITGVIVVALNSSEVLHSHLCSVLMLVFLFFSPAGRGRPPTEPLPDGWIMTFHNSGIPVYLHRETRVVTWSRPYFLGTGSIRVGHDSAASHNFDISQLVVFNSKRQHKPKYIKLSSFL